MIVNLSITADTDNPADVVDLSNLAKVLQVLGEGFTSETAPAPAPPEPEAAPAPAPTRRTRQPKPAPVPEPEPETPAEEEAPETVEETPAAAAEATLDDAVARATALLAGGNGAVVKGALAELGVKRVSELKGAKIGEFLQLLDKG